MKLSAVLLSAVLVVHVAAAKGAKTKKQKENPDTAAADKRNLSEEEEQFFANAFGAVQTDYPASKWRDFLVDGPLSSLVEVDLAAGDYDLSGVNDEQSPNDRKLWYEHTAGWFAIHTDGDRALDVDRKNSEECFGLYEGIGHDGWRFGITTGRVPETEDETDYYLMLFNKWHPYTPVYQAFRGAYKLCIGEKSKYNTAYMIIYTREGCHLLVGKPDSGSDNDLPKLKIRDQHHGYGWHRQRYLRSNEADEEDGTEMVRRELWYDNDHYDETYGKGVVVRFRDGPGYENTFWQIWKDGFSKTTALGRWFHYAYPGGKPPHEGDGDGDDVIDLAELCEATPGARIEYFVDDCDFGNFRNLCPIPICPPGDVVSPPVMSCDCICPDNLCFDPEVGCREPDIIEIPPDFIP